MGLFFVLGIIGLPSPTMIKKKIVHFTQEWLEELPPAPEEGELVTCPACLGE
jgi:hypothetical protein